jgi:hypothetical protein
VLFKNSDFKEKKKRKATTVTEQPIAPTLEEVLTYFELKANGRINDWRGAAQRFFDYFEAVGWRDTHNRRITRWDSRANSWISDEEERQKTKLHHANNQSDRFSERRGTEPTAKSRKGFKGTL